MKRTLIALAVTAAVAAPLAAQAAPKVYGKLNLSVEQYEKEFEDSTKDAEEYSRLMSNASRFGVKGEDELTATLSAVYQIEWQVDGDTAGTTDLKGRNRFVGIKSQDFGTVKLGAYDTYLKLAQDKADLFNDLFGDMEYVVAGENRVNNVIGYESPKLLGAVQLNVMTQAQDKAGAEGNNNHRNGISSSVAYSNEDMGLYVALAMDNNISSKTALFGTRVSDNLRLVATYKIADLSLSAVYGTSEASEDQPDTAHEETGYNLGVAYKLGDQTLKLAYGVAEADDNDAATKERTLLSVGVDHNFTSKTKAFAFYTLREEDKLAVDADSEDSSIAVGIEHSF
jgi:predicted porin